MEEKKISVFKALMDSLHNVLDNFKPFVFALIKTLSFLVLILAAVCGVLAIAGGTPFIYEVKNMAEKLRYVIEAGKVAKYSTTIIAGGTEFFFNNLIPFGIAALAALLLFMLLSIAYIRFSLNIVDKKDAQLSIFSSANVKLLPRYIIGVIIFWLLMIGGLALFVLPALIFYVRFGFFSYFMVDQNSGVIESFKKSWNATSGTAFNVLALYIVYWSLAQFGSLGALITMSVAIVMIAHAYRQLSLKNQNSQSTIAHA